jgi:hypothetical protein
MTQRRTWALPGSLLAGYGGLAVATGIAVAAGGTRQPGLALAVLAVAALLLATQAKALAVAALGPMAWLFYAGFIAGRHGGLTWGGTADVWRFGTLTGSAVIGAGLSWLAARRGESRVPESLQAGSLGNESPRAGSEATVVSLADARADRAD